MQSLLAWAPIFILVRDRRRGGPVDRLLCGDVPDGAQHLVGRALGPSSGCAAGAMGADEPRCSGGVLPGASPFIIAALRLRLSCAWIAVMGAEMISASDWGPAG